MSHTPTPEKRIRVTLLRSPAGRLPNHKATVASLGLKRLRQTVTLKDNAATQGMLRQVRYLLDIRPDEETEVLP